MSDGGNETGVAALSPDDAFALLGNETRIGILQTLAEADDPLSFSDLHDRVGMRDSGQFNYHLDKLRGHFVHQTSEGYDLRRAGNRVIQAVLSGAITEAPVLEPTEIDGQCAYCGASTVVSFREGHLSHYCTECSGTYGESPVDPDPPEDREPEELGFLGKMALPPAGIQERTPMEVYETASVRGTLDLLAIGRDVCPRCSAPIEQSVQFCEDHDTTERVCDRCGRRHAVLCRTSCRNCTYDNYAPLALLCLADPDVLAFLTTHGIDPLVDWAGIDRTEEVANADPFEARFTYAVDDDALTVILDDAASVVDVVEPSSD